QFALGKKLRRRTICRNRRKQHRSTLRSNSYPNNTYFYSISIDFLFETADQAGSIPGIARRIKRPSPLCFRLSYATITSAQVASTSGQTGASSLADQIVSLPASSVTSAAVSCWIPQSSRRSGCTGSQPALRSANRAQGRRSAAPDDTGGKGRPVSPVLRGAADRSGHGARRLQHDDRGGRDRSAVQYFERARGEHLPANCSREIT